ncbi:hypothetical protein TCAL_07038 [Tigriopus californicus]|uniref:BTB domain-containing protein n=1 Tax=Tigriopus californicus TaxID=6832 RepID=A0A553PBG5_TIGCA|nr:hypothetical protein TCAL_07038 [Tigriopus californicus]|eukprot:TCALIF_07038-PA protein Name:"Similar to klhl3 Kelch-like protein 3 (Danio rerio)" AED:0.36 eAED:0.38 QI:0/-1/0/1/-1/1/1/0/93
MTSPTDSEQQLLPRRLPPKHFPDVNLVIGEICLPCHKHMLASSSDVFMTIIYPTNKHQESQTDQVHIDDFDLNALKKLLEYVYHDDIEHIEDT